jgi:hypothetical protein
MDDATNSDAPAVFPQDTEYVSHSQIFKFMLAFFGMHFSPRKWYRLQQRRLGPPRVRVGRAITYKVSDLKEWVDGHREHVRPVRKRATRVA